MKPVRRVIRRQVHSRIAHDVDHDDILRDEGVDNRLRHAYGRALSRLALAERRLGEKRKVREVRHVQRDDPRRAGAPADSREQRGVVGTECPHLRVDVTGLIGAARAATERRGNDVDFVPAREVLSPSYLLKLMLTPTAAR